jgi:hypothetical protein
VKTYSAKYVLTGILFDAQKALENNNSTRQVFDRLRKRLDGMERMDGSQYSRVDWSK